MEINTSTEPTIFEPHIEQLIYNIYQYFLTESRRYRCVNYPYFRNVQQRVSEATCVPEEFVKNVIYRYKVARNKKLLKKSLEHLEKNKKETLDTKTNKNYDTVVTNNPVELSSASDNESTEASPPPKTSKLETIPLQDEHQETICIDTDSNESLKDLHSNTLVENSDNLPKWMKELPKLTKPNLPSIVDPQTTFPAVNPAILPEPPKLIKYGPCKVQTEMNNNVPQTNFKDASIMNNLPPLVKHIPIYSNTEVLIPNQGPIFIGGQKMLHVNTISVDTSDGQKATVGLVLSPVPVLLNTNHSELLSDGTNFVTNYGSDAAACETSAMESDPKIIKVESLADANGYET